MTNPTRQMPAVYRHRVGDLVVTTLGDGGNPFNPDVLRGIGADEAMTMLRDAGRTEPMMITINTFLIQGDGRTVLIDTGAGRLMSPTAGCLPESLAAAGVTPAEIDAVLLTHMHVDHIGGLLDADGAPAFPRADLLIPEAEAAFWLDEANTIAAPEGRRGSFLGAQKAVAGYAGRVRRFTEAPLPGIEAVLMPGHTPGHTGYLVTSGDARLLVCGDIVHAPELQGQRPDIHVMYDLDAAQAIATRRSMLARAANEHVLVAGMHMHFPGLGHVARVGDGYAIQPIAWRPVV